MNAFKIYRASAGSGKTYQLALNYIAIALQAPSNFRHILAVTFTNKATREMKERIIGFLDMLSEGKADDLSRQLEKTLNYNKNKIRELARHTHADILHHYGHFHVTTIDSFFQAIIRSFSREMGLLGNYEVEMDLEKVLDELIDNTLQEVGKDKDLTGWLISFAESRVEAGYQWDMRADIAGLAKEIFSEKFKSFEKDMRNKETMRTMIRSLLHKMADFKKDYEKNVLILAKKGLEIIDKAGLSVARFKNGAKGGPSAFFQKVLNDPSAFPNKLALGGLENYDGWITRNNQEELLLRSVLDNGLMDTFSNLCTYTAKEGRRYRSVLHFQKQIYTFGILADFISRLESYRKENDVMLISDTNYFLKEIISDNETPFIYEKTGTYFRHFLIDEFQDTSDFQWDNFRPLLHDSLAQGYDDMVVGDGKQSIYRFREGNWDLLNNRINREIDDEYLTVIPLQANYRSACNIVYFNNAIFGILPGLLKRLFDKKCNDFISEQLEHLSRSYITLYEDVRQKCRKQTGFHHPGYVKIRFSGSNSSAEEWRMDVLNRLEEQVETLLDAGISPGEIAILVRKQKEGSLVVNKLLSHSGNRSKYHYKVISNESLFLDASWAVRLVTYGIRLINNPADQLARVGLLYEYLKNKKTDPLPDQDIFESTVEDKKFEKLLPPGFIRQFAQLKLQPLLDQAESLIRIFELDKSNEHTAFLTSLQNALSEYADDISNLTQDFAVWWKEQGRQIGVQIPEETDAIRVLTIHKSKGLEYRAVILPFCNWKLDHENQHAPILWCHSGDPLFKTVNEFPLKYSASLINTIFREDYLEEYGKTLIDNLNLLYVALTRAEEVLLIDAKIPKANKQGKKPETGNVSDLLYEIFDNPAASTGEHAEDLLKHFNKDTQIFERGVLKRSDHKIDDKQEREMSSRPYISNSWGEKIRIKTKTDMELGPAFEQRKARITLGIIIHRVLSNIKTTDDADKQLSILKQEGLIGKEDVDEIRKQIHEILDNDKVRPWFDGSYRIKTESPILTNSGKKYQPDRIMLKGNHAIIVDFKTGESSNAHALQIKKYGELLRQMGYEVDGLYLLYTRKNMVKEIL